MLRVPESRMLLALLAFACGCTASTTAATVASEDAKLTGDSGAQEVNTADVPAGVDAATADAAPQDDAVASADAGTAPDTVADVPVVPVKTLFLNELAAQGTPIGAFNPSGGDWVELFNTSDAAVDLKGYRIASKDKAFADAHPLPPGSSIPAHGYLVVYFNHDNAGFPVVDDKLKGSLDSSLRLWLPEGVAQDEVAWAISQVVKGGSFGRSPDGGASWKVYMKGSATPGKPNLP